MASLASGRPALVLRLRLSASTLLWILVGTCVCIAQSEQAPGPPERSSGQWRAFTIPKPPEEIVPPAPASNLLQTIRERTRLPPQHDMLRTTVGLGHVLQRDWGVELATAGRVRGVQADLNSFLTVGGSGIEAPSARLSLFEPHAGWGAEFGDVISELRGLARGVRFGWRGGQWHRPSVSVYLPSARLHDTSTVVGYRDEVRLFSRVVAGGEIMSDGSHFVRTGFAGRRFDVQASYRRVFDDDPSRDAGVMASYAIGRGIMLNAGLRTFESPTDTGTARLLSVRLPVGSVLALTLEDSRSTGWNSDDISNAVGLQLLRGPVQLMQRYQWGESEYFRVGDPFGIEQRQLQTAASFSPAPWASFSPQTITQWLPDGRAQQWQELNSEFRLSSTARLQMYTSLPNLADTKRFRTRFTQELRRQLTLVMDYGQISAFQSRTVTGADGPRFSVMLRKTWRTPTPAYGGEVSGRVIDQRGAPVIGAGVRLGSYLAFTDEAGRYLFPRVPHGDFDLTIDREFLPARYAWDGKSRRIVMRGAGRHVADVTVVPLDSIGGRAYLDANRNGRFDAGEGRRGVVIRLSDRVTATDADGAYGFDNLAPGTYVVRVDQERLADSLAVAHAEVQVTLQAGRAATGIDFVLAEKQKPVILKRLAK